MLLFVLYACRDQLQEGAQRIAHAWGQFLPGVARRAFYQRAVV